MTPRRSSRLVVLVSLALVLSACGDDDSGADPAAAGGEAWSFTDDRGVEVTLPERPQRIVAYHNAAAALIPLGVAPVGVFGGSGPEDSPLLTGLDLDGVESVGDVYGELNIEALAATRPDLIVTLFDPAQEGPPFGFLDDAQAQAEEVAPIVALDGAADARDAIGRFEDLAEQLGADVQSADVVADRQAFDAAVDDLRAAVDERPGLSAVAFQAYAGDGIYFARPDAFPSLRLFQEAGLDLVEPGSARGDVNDDFVSSFWELTSLEQGGRYPADLVLLGNNAGTLDAEQILEEPTLAGHPAVRSGAVVEWQVLDRFSYEAFASQLATLADAVRSADPSTTP